VKLKFKDQKYQNEAVQAVVDCFAGQINTTEREHIVLHGKKDTNVFDKRDDDIDVFKNAKIRISEEKLLENIRAVQQIQKLPLSNVVNGKIQNTFPKTENKQKKKQETPKDDLSCLQLNIEMETGTGKTFCYIKTIFELNKKYGWTKFIIVVPSIAIREGVKKSMEITADYFSEMYDKQILSFVYNSQQFADLINFTSNNIEKIINVMIINVQAFNATGKDNRRIYEEQDSFHSRKPIDILSACRPILILDEPQKMEGEKTLSSLTKFNPLFVLRYSATHKTIQNKIYRLDAVDAYNQKLVKKIQVYGIQAYNTTANSPYMFFQSVHAFTDKPPYALLELYQQNKDASQRTITRRLQINADLYELSNKMEAYKDNYVVTNIDAGQGTITFANGKKLTVGDVTGNNIEEQYLRKFQIRKTIEEHFHQEQKLYKQGIKTLSLFFIDKVEKYRNYKEEDTKGEYARIFEEEYTNYLQENKNNFTEEYQKYLDQIEVAKTHNGYFSIDKKTKRFVDSDINVRGENAGLSNDTDAYDLILKDKERLLSFEEPTRFIFSHSALREGWDNPNVFVLCTLKQSDNTLSRRQEIGRGLRICVNKNGERMDDPDEVHQINVLTVVTSESYTDFVTNLQDEIRNSVDRPTKADSDYFKGKTLTKDNNPNEKIEIEDFIFMDILYYLKNNNYIDALQYITTKYTDDRQNEQLAELPENLQEYKKSVFSLIDLLYQPQKMNKPEKYTNIRNNELFNSKEFQELWRSINKRAFYQITLETDTLIQNAIKKINEDLTVSKIRFEQTYGQQKQEIKDQDLEQANSIFENKTNSRIDLEGETTYSYVYYDLIGILVEKTGLRRKTIGKILQGIKSEKFKLFQNNPEFFIVNITEIINQEKQPKQLKESIKYEIIDQEMDINIFSETEKIESDNILTELKKHVHHGLKYDSKSERCFAKELEDETEVIVYSKLPRKFTIPTIVGNYNPDWAIAFKEGTVKHIHFVAETKGSNEEGKLRLEEKIKIESAENFFDALNQQLGKSKKVVYKKVKILKDVFDAM